MKRIINFSGGKTSGMMTILEYNPKTDYVIFCDTGREHPKTYEFIDLFEKKENIPLIRLGYEKAYEQFLSIRNFKEIPNIAKRSCTRELKIFPSRRWARKNIGMEYQNLIGFRVDEKERILKNKNKWKKVQNKFPLNERGINKYMVNSFWNEKEYKLDLVPILGNCTLCFMKGKNAIINILKHFPELATPWIQDEEKAKETFGHTYLNNISIKECLKIAQAPNLFSELPLDEITPSFNCNCTP